MRAGHGWAVLMLAATLGTSAPAHAAGLVSPAPAPGCPTATDGARFASTARLLADDRVMARLGPRPTASPAHAAFVDWIARKLAAIPGMRLDAAPFEIDRRLARDTALATATTAGELRDVADSGPVPYAAVTGEDGATAPLVVVPAGTPIAAANVAGKIVVRDTVPGSIPYRNYNAVAWFKHDPDLSLTKAELSGETYERDFSGTQAKVTDLQDATAAGAAGLVFVQGFPRAQVDGQYAPYEGIHWRIPALYVGADEGAALKTLAAGGGKARIRISASQQRASTRMLIATLPGVSSERMVVESHTDGMNAVWDNGPIAMLALARYFAGLPQACRPRTLQFVFTTGHLYQRLTGPDQKGGSAKAEAKQLDADYDDGSVAMVFALEHLGAREYAAVPRTDGGPGRVLEPSGRSEVNTLFAGESPALAAATIRTVVKRGLDRTYVLRGADMPGLHIPLQQSFGGEGSSYQQRLIPTIAFVTGPWTLLNPSFGMEALDGELMRKQTLVFADLIHDLADVPSLVLGGAYVPERAARSLLCGSGMATMGFVTC